MPCNATVRGVQRFCVEVAESEESEEIDESFVSVGEDRSGYDGIRHVSGTSLCT